ncbi:hypothetical protein ACFO1V_09505 [Daeguia caeni]|uniref:Uncharacterized protein n=1 Tax=Daeguia caeni TaxID=439612 RepID=A0ABV9H7I1_9HYPH
MAAQPVIKDLGAVEPAWDAFCPPLPSGSNWQSSSGLRSMPACHISVPCRLDHSFKAVLESPKNSVFPGGIRFITACLHKISGKMAYLMKKKVIPLAACNQTIILAPLHCKLSDINAHETKLY